MTLRLMIEEIFLDQKKKMKQSNTHKSKILGTFPDMTVTAGSFWSNSYIEYKSNGDRKKT